jgi:hypothetical protein
VGILSLHSRTPPPPQLYKAHSLDLTAERLVSANKDAAHEALTKAHAALASGDVDKALSLAMKVREWPAVPHASSLACCRLFRPRHACTLPQSMSLSPSAEASAVIARIKTTTATATATTPARESPAPGPAAVPASPAHAHGVSSAQTNTCHCGMVAAVQRCNPAATCFATNPQRRLRRSRARHWRAARRRRRLRLHASRLRRPITTLSWVCAVCVACPVRLACGVAAALGLVS